MNLVTVYGKLMLKAIRCPFQVLSCVDGLSLPKIKSGYSHDAIHQVWQWA